LEKVVNGYDFNSKGKRVDGLLATLSDIQQLVLVEIKLPDAKLIEEQERPACWSVSREVTAGIAQIQKTVQMLKEKYFSKVEFQSQKY
jgi:hypothetical protein